MFFKIATFSFFACLLAGSLLALDAEPPLPSMPSREVEVKVDESRILSASIAAMERRLESEKKLQELLKNYLSLEHECRKNPTNKQAASQFLKTHRQLLSLVEQENLGHLLRPQFVSELYTLDKLTKARGISRP